MPNQKIKGAQRPWEEAEHALPAGARIREKMLLLPETALRKVGNNLALSVLPHILNPSRI